MATERQVSIIETQSKTSGFVESAQQAKALDAAFDGVTTSSKALTQAEISLESSVNRLDARFSETVRTANEVARAQQMIARARLQGLGTEEQYARILTNVTERHNTAMNRAAGGMRQLGAAANDNAKNFGLASHQIQNLGFQLNDLVVQIGSGGGIFRPLLQQGAQVHQILSMSEGGVGGVISRVVAQLKAVGPAAIIGWGAAATAIGGVVGSTLLAVKAMIDYREELVATQRVLKTGAGRLSGIEPSDIQSAAKSASAAGGMSTSEARNVALELAKTGKIGVQVMTDLTGITERYAKTLGIDTTQAAKQLGVAFAEPGKGVTNLAQQMKFLSAAQVEHIALLARTGPLLAAQAALYDALAKGPLVNTKTELLTLSKVWERFVNGIVSDVDVIVQKLGQIGMPRNLQQQIEDIQALPGTGLGGQKTPEDTARREAAIAGIRKQQAAELLQTEQALQAEASKVGQAITESLTPAIGKFNELQTQATQLQAALRFPDLLPDAAATAAALEMVKNAMAGATTASEARAQTLERLRLQGELGIQAINATTAAEIASVAAKQALLGVEGQLLSDAERAQVAENARAQSIAASNKERRLAVEAGDKQITQGRLQLQSITATTVAEKAQLAAQQSMLQTEGSLLTMAQRLILAEQARQQVLLQTAAQLRDMTATQNDQIRLLELEIRTVGMNEMQRNKLIAVMQAENELRRMGIPLLSEEGRAYVENARRMAELTQKLEDARAAHERQAAAIRQAADAYRDYSSAAQHAGKVTKSIIPAENTMASLMPEGGGQFQAPLAFGAGDLNELGKRLIQAFKDQGMTQAQAEEAARKEASLGHFDTRQPGGNVDRLLDYLPEANDNIAELGTSATTAADKLDKLDVGSLGAPIEARIDQLLSLQEAALSRVYKPDPYMERNPEFFYNGEKIMKEGQDRIFDGLQTQIEKLQSLQASLGQLVVQGQQLPMTLVNALIAAGFGDIAEKIIAAFASSPAPSATPNPTAVLAQPATSSGPTLDEINAASAERRANSRGRYSINGL